MHKGPLSSKCKVQPVEIIKQKVQVTPLAPEYELVYLHCEQLGSSQKDTVACDSAVLEHELVEQVELSFEDVSDAFDVSGVGGLVFEESLAEREVGRAEGDGCLAENGLAQSVPAVAGHAEAFFPLVYETVYAASTAF